MYALADPSLEKQGDWKSGGAATVEVQYLPPTLSLREGERVSYQIRLSHPPLESVNEGEWWVRIRVNDVVYIDGHFPPGKREDAVIGWVLFRTLFDDGFPGLFHAIAARISDIIRSLPERRAGAHSV